MIGGKHKPWFANLIWILSISKETRWGDDTEIHSQDSSAVCLRPLLALDSHGSYGCKEPIRCLFSQVKFKTSLWSLIEYWVLIRTVKIPVFHTCHSIGMWASKASSKPPGTQRSMKNVAPTPFELPLHHLFPGWEEEDTREMEVWKNREAVHFVPLFLFQSEKAVKMGIP